MNLLFLGPPASGKGTQAELVAKAFHLFYFEAGEVLREKVKGKSSLAQKIDQVMNQEGKLVPVEIMNRVVEEWLRGRDLSHGVVFDGFPRKLSQYLVLEKMLAKKKAKIDRAIFLKVSQAVSIKRISSRRVCPQCDAEYNLVTNKPKKDELCDRCQLQLKQRQDDQPEVVKRRLIIYQQNIQPLIAYLRQKDLLLEIDGERPIKTIHQEIMRRLQQ
jgi:adenylate kinase